MKISIYMNLFLYKFGGTECYTANLIEILQKLFPSDTVSVITENRRDKNIINKYDFIFTQNKMYGLNINPEKITLQLINEKEITVNENKIKPIRILQFLKRQNNFFSKQKKLRRLTKNQDLFINCSRYSFYGMAKKNIAIIHFPKDKISEIPINKKIPFLKYLAKKQDSDYIKKNNIFLPNSLFTSYWLSTIWGIPESKITVVYPPVTPVSKKSEKVKNQIFICSRIDSTKKIDILINAFLNSETLKKNCKLVIAGSVSEEKKEYIDSIAISSSSKVKIVFEPTRSKIEELYAESDFFWHAKGLYEENPLYFEHFGITTVEAMSAGCIPIVINKGGQQEIVDKSCGFKWNTIDELIQATETLIKNDELTNKLRNECIKRSKLFQKDKFIEKIKKIIESE